MMIKFVNFMLLLLSFMFLISGHTSFSMMVLVLYSLFISLKMYFVLKMSWQPCSLLILISSGMLMVFAYISNMVPNPKVLFDVSYTNFVLFLSVCLFFFSSNFDIYFLLTGGCNLAYDLSYYFMNNNFKFLIIFMMMMLILILMIMLKIIMKEEGPMRMG